MLNPTESSALKRLCWVLAPHQVRVALLILATVFMAVASAIPALLTKRIIDVAILQGRPGVFALSIFALLGAAGLFAVIGYGQTLLSAQVATSISREMRKLLVEKLLFAPLRQLETGQIGPLLTRLASDVDALEAVWVNLATGVFSNVVTILVSFVILLTLNVPLAVTSLIILPLLVLPANFFASKITALRTVSRARRDRLATLAVETLTLHGITFVKSAGIREQEVARIGGLSEDIRDADLRTTVTAARYSAYGNFISIGLTAILWAVGFYLLQRHAATLGTVVATIALVLRLYGPVSALASMRVQVANMAAFLQRFDPYLELDSEDDRYGVVPDDTGHGSAPASIAAESISFEYPNSSGRVLDDVSFSVSSPGQYCISGPSGAGKSTLAKILAGLYEPTSGHVTWNGRSYENVSPAFVRRRVALVPQEPFMLNASLRDNLTLMKAGATDDELRAALKKALLLEFVDAAPSGLDTVIGDRGLRLSGGQRQRLAIARLFLTQPDVIILDEATSSIDEPSERAILDNVERAFPDALKLIVTHRASVQLRIGNVIRLGPEAPSRLSALA